MVRVVDSHCHLQAEGLRDQAARVWGEARDGGVVDLLIPGIEPQGARHDLELAQALDVWCSVGCHPCHAERWDPELVSPLLSHPRVVAVGECGLDYFHKPFDPVLQDRVFRAQIGLAKEANLPLILHNRESDRDLVRILREEGASRGVFHCFGGDERCLEEALELGFHVSFAGNVTYPSARFRQLVARVPADRILVETDAPWLAPAPHRGSRNRPALVVEVLKEVARLRDEDPVILGATVIDNFRTCFPRASRGGR